MPFIPVANTLMVEVVAEVQGQVCENTMYFERTTAWNLGQIQDWLEQMRDIIETDLIPLLSSTVTVVRLIGTLLTAADALKVVFELTPPLVGLDGGAPMPNNVSYTVTFNSVGRGRSSRGRNYIFGLTGGDTGGNNIQSATRTGLVAYYNAIRQAALTNDSPMVIVSRYSGVNPTTGDPIPRAAGVTSDVISITTFDNVLDSQRRRLPGRGS